MFHLVHGIGTNLYQIGNKACCILDSIELSFEGLKVKQTKGFGSKSR